MIVGALLAACGSASTPDRAVAGAARRVGIPLDSYWGVAWLRDDEIVVDRFTPPVGGEARINVTWSVTPDGSKFRKVVLPGVVDGCSRIEYRAPQRLLDGDLATLLTCQIPRNALKYYTWIVRIVDGGSSSKVLVPGAPIEPVVWESGIAAPDDVLLEYAMSRDGKLGIGGSTANCGTLVRLTPDGTVPLDITIGEGERSWNLKEQENADPTKDGCTRFGTASFPSSDPTFSKVAFWAEPDAVNRKVFERDDVRADLMTIDPVTLKLEKLLGGVSDIGPLKWSPTGRWIAFIGDPVRRGFGLWLFEVATKRLVLVRSDHATPALDWSPKGDALVLIEEGDRGDDDAIDHRTMWVVPILQP